MRQNNFDEAVLAFINGMSFKDNIARLYRSGDINDRQLADCVKRGFITLPEYNDIIERANG